ncbi:hypothetical protein BU14_0105s0014 [Porphyra umbilicalis]|uniref:Uncharacterized protein n=1 Tax=Porphyra umbilicalis TaxID=2786 RepID=A0A1X6PCY3_PORUM|nr:hypothetical protein BU14_0105s0014 [Porphyra umbilicalis]|eukprot:OSX78596.1 hypothetical protein BU14_0105s0014 [Porphyra umbilicalis]
MKRSLLASIVRARESYDVPVASLLLVSYVVLLFRTWQQQRRYLLRARVSWEMVAPTAAATHRPAGTAALADGVCVLGAGVSGVPDSRWCGFQQQFRGHHDERGR